MALAEDPPSGRERGETVPWKLGLGMLGYIDVNSGFKGEWELGFCILFLQMHST